MEELSFTERIWLNRFRSVYSEVHADRVGSVWVATVPLPDGERTRKFDRFAGMREWLERWAAGR